MFFKKLTTPKTKIIKTEKYNVESLDMVQMEQKSTIFSEIKCIGVCIRTTTEKFSK